MNIGLVILGVSCVLLILNQFFPSRNSGIGLRIPVAYQSAENWKKTQRLFYLLLICNTTLCYVLNRLTIFSESIYIGTCLLGIVFSGMFTSILIKYKTNSKHTTIKK